MADDKDLLSGWSALNAGLQKLTEDECVALLKREKKGQRRLSFLLRIYGRVNKLRTQRERTDIAGSAK